MKYSARVMLGSGLIDADAIEHEWSALRPFNPLLKYMGRAAMEDYVCDIVRCALRACDSPQSLTSSRNAYAHRQIRYKGAEKAGRLPHMQLRLFTATLTALYELDRKIAGFEADALLSTTSAAPMPSQQLPPVVRFPRCHGLDCKR